MCVSDVLVSVVVLISPRVESQCQQLVLELEKAPKQKDIER